MAGSCGARAWSFEGALVGLVEAVVGVIVSLLQFFLLLYAFCYAWMLTAGIGAWLIFFRWAFFKSIPWLIRHADFVVGVLNVFIATFELLENVVITVVDAIAIIADAVDFLTGHKPAMKVLDYVPFNVLTVGEYESELRLIARECAPIDSVVAIFDEWVPRLVDEATCPAYRAIQPVSFGVGRWVYRKFGWWVSDPTPYPGNNCDRPEGPRHGVLCSCLAVGYPVFEVLLPLVFLGIIVLSSGPQLWSLARYTFATVYRALRVAACYMEGAVGAALSATHVCCAPLERL